MIKGITVKLHVKTQSSVDGFGRPTYTTTKVDIANVLVGDPSASEIKENNDLYGKRLAYTLAIPKGDAHTWTDTYVEFFGQTFRTFGPVTQGIEENIPLRWNKKVMVELYV